MDSFGSELGLTPNFVKWKQKGIFFNNFFANGFQTRHAEIAAYCSVMPNYGESVFSHYNNNHFLCLPEILKRKGYSTSWINGADAAYDNQLTIFPKIGFQKIIDRFDFDKFGRATAKFDPLELAKLNSQIVQELDFADVEARLADIGVTCNAEFWLAVRGNLATVDEARVWWDICTQPITPIIEAPAITNAAAALLPAGDLDSQIWSPWTKSIAAENGVTGKDLFMPIRLALTGRVAGPEIAPLLAIMGRERVIKRLQGQAA